MKIKKIIENHLKNLKISSGDNIVVHADITKFGIYSEQLPKIIIKKILTLIGKNGNLAMPLYNIGIKNKIKYNLSTYYSKKNNSILSIFFFKKYKPKRSSSIIHSHIIKGPLEKNFINRIAYNSFGKNSDFEFFKNNNFKLLLLGCEPDQGCTYIHHIEEKTKVPYRYKIKLNFQLTNSIKNKIQIYYYARKKNIKTNFNLILKNKNLRKKIIIDKLKFGFSYMINIEDLDYYIYNALQSNRKLFLK
jgi:aminoglycoside N3'-acetyltransferase